MGFAVSDLCVRHLKHFSIECGCPFFSDEMGVEIEPAQDVGAGNRHPGIHGDKHGSESPLGDTEGVAAIALKGIPEFTTKTCEAQGVLDLTVAEHLHHAGTFILVKSVLEAALYNETHGRIRGAAGCRSS